MVQAYYFLLAGIKLSATGDDEELKANMYMQLGKFYGI